MNYLHVFYSRLLLFCTALSFSFAGCGIYKFEDVSVPPEVKTVHIKYIDNNASYVNPQLSPNLTDRLKQKIVNQSRLTSTANENADWIISGHISDYSVSTSGVSSGVAGGRQQESVNRLTVSVVITVDKKISTESPQQFTISRSFEFAATQSLQAAEAALLDDMIKNLTDEIFNRIFSNW